MSHLATVGLDFVTKNYKAKIDGKEHKIQVWDTAG